MVPQAGFEPATPGLMVGRVGIEPTQVIQPLRLLTLRPFVLFPSPVLYQLSYWSIYDGFTYPH